MTASKNTKKKPSKKKVKKEEDEDDDENGADKTSSSPKKKGPKATKKNEPKSPIKTSRSAPVDLSERIWGTVDAELSHEEVSILQDEKGNYYDAVLTFTEGNSDKFYIAQVFEEDSKFLCFIRWGRNGTKGQNQTLGPFKNKTKAIEEFEKKFLDKSGCDWSTVIDGTYEALPSVNVNTAS